MSKITKFDRLYISIAKEVSKLSYCKRAQVGAVIVKGINIISYGYNGTLPGQSNICEDEFNNTNPNVVHSEINAILKAAKTNNSCEDAFMYCTMSPCMECAKAIVQSGITKVYYVNDYRDTNAIKLLQSCDVEVIKVIE